MIRMGNTTIEWTWQRLPGGGLIIEGRTVNGWSGCTKVILPSGKPDPQCMHCYAEREEDKRRGRSRWGRGNPRTLFKSWSANMRKWNEEAKKLGVAPFVFGHSLSDWADEEVPDAWRDAIMDVAEKCTNLVMLWLTKRVEYAAEYWHRRYPTGIPDNFYFGFSAGNVEGFLTRAKWASIVPAAVKFVSIEPYVEPFAELLRMNVKRPEGWAGGWRPLVDWVLTGGETDTFERIASRIVHSSHYEDVIDVAHEAGLWGHFKQWGNLAPLTQSLGGVVPVRIAGVTRSGIHIVDMRIEGRAVEGPDIVSGRVTVEQLKEAFGIAPDDDLEIHGFLGGPQGKHAHGRMLNGREVHEHPPARLIA